MTDMVFPRMSELLAPCVNGSVEIEHSTFGEREVAYMRAKEPETRWETGTFAVLRINEQIYMSDHQCERDSSMPAVLRARGKTLIAGLGLGMILHPILRKDDVLHVTIVEKFEDVIAVVRPTLPWGPAEWRVDHADIFDFVPPPEMRYDCIFFDIWPQITPINLLQMEVLHRVWRPRLAPGGWLGSWMRMELLQRCRSAALVNQQDHNWATLMAGCGNVKSDKFISPRSARQILGMLRLLRECKLETAIRFAKRVSVRIEEGTWPDVNQHVEVLDELDGLDAQETL